MTAYIIRRLLVDDPDRCSGSCWCLSSSCSSRPAARSSASSRCSRAPIPAPARAPAAGRAAISERADSRADSRAAMRAAKYRGAQGLDPKFIEQLEKQFGFDKPAYERFFLMLWNYIRFDFGKSYFRDVSVLQLIKEKLPVSISLGIWLTLLTYLISIPLGIRKAIRDGSHFDVVDVGRHHHRLRDPGLPVRDPADHPVRGRLVLQLVPAARVAVGRRRRLVLRTAAMGRISARSCSGPPRNSISSSARRWSYPTTSGTWCCRSSRWGSPPSPP